MSALPEASPPLVRKRASWKLRIAALMFGCGLAVILGEVGLRICGYPHVGCYQPDMNLGTRLVPDYRGWQHQEGHVYIRTNSQGWRDREHAAVPAANTFRIAILGDSFSEAVQVELEETYWSVLERTLSTCPALTGKTIEVLNFGVSGYGTTQEYLCLEHEVWLYQPDLILLQFLPGNDVRNNSRQLEPERRQPFHVLRDGHLELDNSFRAHEFMSMAPGAEARNRAEVVLQWKNFFVTNVAILNLAYEVRHSGAAADSGLEPGIEANVFFPPTDEVWSEAWLITDLVLAQIQQSCATRNVPLVVFTANNGIQVHPDADEIRRIAEIHHQSDVLYPDEHLADISRQVGFHFVSLTLPMREIAQREQRYFHGFENTAPGSGHWNVDGHRVAGELLADALCENASEWLLPWPR